MKHRSFLLYALAAAAALFYSSTSIRSQVIPARRGVAPAPFHSKDGKFSGWKVTIPGGRPLATPAVVAGQVFLGGGFGSHEFYSLDAATGNTRWIYHTADDGPTAAVFSDGKIAFNTESCELEVITQNGKPLWKKWLGDPLMSMPAAADGVVYMAYPNSRGDAKYYVAAFDLGSGKELWKSPVASEIITAPVIDGERLYLATVDGSLVSFDRRRGARIFEENKNATSAPAVWNGQCFFSRREASMVSKNGSPVPQQNEMVAKRANIRAARIMDLPATTRPADYLDYEKRAANSAQERTSQSLDASVGFAGALNKGSANISKTRANLGKGSVHGVWAYQGSKPFVDHGRVFSSMGNAVICTDAESGKVLWTRTIGVYKTDADKTRAQLDSSLTPPAIVNGKVFVVSTFGEVLALSAQTGDTLWSVDIGEPVAFQPVITRGRVYVATNNGSVFSFDTGDAHDDGWQMWGATSLHNGLVQTTDQLLGSFLGDACLLPTVVDFLYPHGIVHVPHAAARPSGSCQAPIRSRWPD
jgi:Ca-activated chloride channel family protein